MSDPKPITDIDVLKAMQIYGGAFAHALAVAGLHADKHNLARIKAGWPDYWAKYTGFAQRIKDNGLEVDGTTETEV